MSDETRQGWAYGDGGTSATGKAILAAAARVADPTLADDITRATKWRSEYVPLVGRLTATQARGRSAVDMARAGLAEADTAFTYRQGGTDRTPSEIDWDGSAPEPVVYEGTAEPVRELVVPYRGGELRGAALASALDRWVDRAIVQPAFAAAIRDVLDHPEWLSLPDHRPVLFGAAGEMGPLPALARWGADVVAIDVPVAGVQRRLAETARSGAGRVTVPAGTVPGLDFVEDSVGTAAFLAARADGRTPVVGMYAYADGGTHVLLTRALDALLGRLRATAPDAVVAYLGTPTDAYVVPASLGEVVDRHAAREGLRSPLHGLARALSGSRVFVPGLSVRVPGDDGTDYSVADVVLPMQGPNYVVAKRLQRWRAVLDRADGRASSFTVAPASFTRSVTKNRTFAVAYSGAHRFGVEVFAADTARTLMAAKLVADLHRPMTTESSHPEALFFEDAAHGGFWTQPYEPRSVLPFAALAGLPSLVPGIGQR